VGILLGVVAALLLGLSDFSAARAGRHEPSLTVTRTALLVSCFLTPPLLLLVRSSWTGRDTLLAACSGIAMMAGLAMLYRGYAVARIGIVAPTCSVMLSVVPVVSDLALGRTPSAVGALGMVLGVAGVGLATYERGGAGSARAGIVLGGTSGLAFGIAFSFLSRTSKASGLSPIVLQRSVAFAILLVVWSVRRRPERLLATSGQARWPAIAAGLAAGLAVAALQLAYRRSSAGPVSVATSQFATAAVLLSVVFNHERLRRLQWAGIVLAAVGVALLATS
jgi:drug/metabolite transporter (DMT)-like permease